MSDETKSTNRPTQYYTYSILRRSKRDIQRFDTGSKVGGGASAAICSLQRGG